MKHFMFLLWSVLGLCATAQSATPLPPDTTGQQAVVTLAAGKICEQLTSYQATKKLSDLTQPQAMQLFQEWMVATITSQPKVAKYLQAPGRDAKQFGTAMMRRMIVSCPSSVELATQLAGAKLPEGTMTAVTPEQQQLIVRMAHKASELLVQQMPLAQFRQLTPEQRKAAFGEAMKKAMEQHADEITKAYGSAIFFDQARLSTLGAKVGVQIAQEPASVDYLMLVGQDQTAKSATP